MRIRCLKELKLMRDHMYNNNTHKEIKSKAGRNLQNQFQDHLK